MKSLVRPDQLQKIRQHPIRGGDRGERVLDYGQAGEKGSVEVDRRGGAVYPSRLIGVGAGVGLDGHFVKVRQDVHPIFIFNFPHNQSLLSRIGYLLLCWQAQPTWSKTARGID